MEWPVRAWHESCLQLTSETSGLAPDMVLVFPYGRVVARIVCAIRYFTLVQYAACLSLQSAFFVGDGSVWA